MAGKIALPKVSMGAASSRQTMGLLALLLALVGGWLAWTGFSQWRAESAETALSAERERVAAEINRQLQGAQKRVADAAAQAAVAAALAAGDVAAAEQAFGAALKGASEASIQPADLKPLYEALPQTGYGRLAVLEQVQGGGKPVLRIARAGKAPAMLVGVPLADGRVALAALPIKPLADVFAAASVGDGYLALRQGSTDVAEKGNGALAGLAESQATRVAAADMRVVAGVPASRAEAPFGLGAMVATGLGAFLLLAAVALLLRGRRAQAGQEAAEIAHAPTLDETLAAERSGPAAIAGETEAMPGAASGEEAATAEAPGAMSFDAPVLPGIEVDPGIFRAYDIRGVVGSQLSAEVARAIGQAIGSQMQEQGLDDIVVGRDGRLSGPELAGALIEGLRSTGRRVIDIGLGPTPLIYFAAFHLRAGSCVAVTGSHNPPDYNGFKIVIGGETLSGEAIGALRERIVSGRLHVADAPGELESREVGPDYILQIASDIQVGRALKVVVDAGNGAAGEIGPRVLEAIGAEVVPIYCEIDGNFPNHHPDPSEPHNLQDLIATVRETGADLGIAFDGDGDRLGVVTPQGHNIFPDRLLMLFAEDVLERQPGAVIVYDVKCTGALMPWILRHGGSPLMWKTGHSLIKAKMRETEAELAGEMSGHFFFKERWFGFDDGIYAAARLLEIMGGRDEDADTMFAAIPEGLSTPEIKVPVADPHAFIDRFVAMGEFEGGRATTIDGLRADWEDGWGLVRASNTTPILVLRFEATDPAALQRIQGLFRERLLALDPGLELPF